MSRAWAYYNEIDPQAAAWLRELIKQGHIANGEVDERSIEDVRPDDLAGFRQCHFFAGIGGWSLALRLAGWPDNRPIWTGSCPCQPFSSAGQGAGFADERHRWPDFQWLIQQRRPAIVAGEQVASHHANAWIDLVSTDLEAMGYRIGAIPFPAAGVGAPHIRDRNYWVADASGEGLAQRERDGRVQRETVGAQSWQAPVGSCVALRDGTRRPVEPGTFPLAHGLPARVVRLRGYGNAIVPQAAEAFIRAYCDARGLGLIGA